MILFTTGPVVGKVAVPVEVSFFASYKPIAPVGISYAKLRYARTGNFPVAVVDGFLTFNLNHTPAEKNLRSLVEKTLPTSS